ncbi:MAG: aldo/keto reductase [Nitrososphaeria archaeon]
MEYRELGRTGIRVSAVGIGTWQWGSREWGWGRDYGMDDLRAAVDVAEGLGVNFVDTAEIYGMGRSEEIIGELVRGRRDKFILATKVGPHRLTRDGIVRACEGSIRRMGISSVDLCQVHWPNPLVPMRTYMSAMEQLLESGRISAIGVSNFDLRKLEEARASLSRSDIASNQVEYSLVDRGPEAGLLPYMEREGLTLISYSPLGQGILAHGGHGSHAVGRFNALFHRHVRGNLAPLLEALRSVASAKGANPAQIALAWLLSRGPHVVPIPGVKRESHVRDAASATSIHLSAQDIALLDSAAGVSG